jgi:hypothetical protein
MTENGTRWKMERDGVWNKIEDEPKWGIEQDRGWKHERGWNQMEDGTRQRMEQGRG